MEDSFRASIDELDEDTFEDAVIDFITENRLLGEWLVWIEKWKALHTLVGR